MALTNKEKKKLTKRILTLDEKATSALWEIVIQYFVLFWLFLLWDKIAQALLVHSAPGMGWEQVVGCIVCIVQMIRYNTKIGR